MIKSDSAYKNLILCFFVLLFMHIALYNTPILIPAYIVIPAVIAYSIYVFGISVSLMFCAGSVIFNAVTSWLLPGFNWYVSIAETLSIAIPGIACGLCISKKLKAADTLITTTASAVVFPLGYLAYAKYVHEFDIAKEISDTITDTIAQQFNLIKTVYPEISEVFAENEGEIFALLGLYVPGLMPCVLIVLCIIYSVIIYAAAKALCRRKMIANSFFIQGLDCVYLPKPSTAALLVSMLFAVMETNSIVFMAAINFIIVILVFYMLQGLSLIEYNLKQKNFNSLTRLFIILGIIVALTVISVIAPILNPVFALAILGVSDSAGDYRKLNKNKDEFNEN